MLNLSAIQRLVDTVTQSSQEIQEENEWRKVFGSDPIDNSKVLNGINPDDLLEAVACLKLVIDPERHHDITKLLGLKRKTGPKKPSTLDETPGCEELLVVHAYAKNVLTYSEAVEALTVGRPAGDTSAAKRFLKKHRRSKKLLG